MLCHNVLEILQQKQCLSYYFSILYNFFKSLMALFFGLFCSFCFVNYLCGHQKFLCLYLDTNWIFPKPPQSPKVLLEEHIFGSEQLTWSSLPLTKIKKTVKKQSKSLLNFKAFVLYGIPSSHWYQSWTACRL